MHVTISFCVFSCNDNLNIRKNRIDVLRHKRKNGFFQEQWPGLRKIQEIRDISFLLVFQHNKRFMGFPWFKLLSFHETCFF